MNEDHGKRKFRVWSKGDQLRYLLAAVLIWAAVLYGLLDGAPQSERLSSVAFNAVIHP